MGNFYFPSSTVSKRRNKEKRAREWPNLLKTNAQIDSNADVSKTINGTSNPNTAIKGKRRPFHMYPTLMLKHVRTLIRGPHQFIGKMQKGSMSPLTKIQRKENTF